MNFRPYFIALVISLSTAPLQADWKDAIGFTRLQMLAGAELSGAPLQGLTQVEASMTDPTTGIYTYLPDSTNPLFSGKTINNASPAKGTAVSSHATHVGTNFYATTSLLPGTGQVDVYYAGDWIISGTGGFLNLGSNSAPKTETRAVQNHSWVVESGWSDAQVVEADERLDYAINRDGFVCVVGSDNNGTTTLPQFLCQSYHTISVGLDNGGHSAGFTAYDGSGRIKPDIVAPSAAPEYATSWTTPMVSGAAGLLYAKLSAAPYSLAGADLPRVIKALLLASATKTTLPSWANTSTRPLDLRYGAGVLNILHAYNDLRAGKATASSTNHYGIRGWAAESVSQSSAKTYYFTIPAGAPSTPFSAALIWHRVVSKSGFNTWSSSLADLNLHLYHASGTTLGTLIAESLSPVDNVELIDQPALPPGDYALRVDSSVSTGTPYALAWHSLPAVTVTASIPTAREIDGQAGLLMLTRSGDTTLPLYVPLVIGGTATPGTHYQALPASVTIPQGQASTTLPVTPMSDNLAQGNRSVTVAVAADFALVSDPSQPAVVTIQDKPFDTWRFDHFTTPELSEPSISGENADPDGDQLPNLVEYALGLSPIFPDASPVAMIDAGGFLALSAAKNSAATDVSWSAEASADLQTWSPAVVVTNTSTSFEAHDTMSVSSAEKRFLRLKITRP